MAELSGPWTRVQVCHPFGTWWDRLVVPAGETASPWSLTFPAIYLLVPGSTIFKGAFTGILQQGAERAIAFAGFESAFFIVGLSLAFGIKLGVFVYSLIIKVGVVHTDPTTQYSIHYSVRSSMLARTVAP